MIEDQNITVAGTIGGEPELRFTPSGVAVANFSVAVNHRFFNKNTQQWEEKGTDWWRVNVWRQQAENVAESFKKGDRVMVFGKVASRQFEARDGAKVTTWEITAEECAHSAKFTTTVQNRTQRTQADQQGQPSNQGGQYGGRGGQAPVEDPWASGYQNQANYGGQQGRPQGQPVADPWDNAPASTPGGFLDEPPF